MSQMSPALPNQEFYEKADELERTYHPIVDRIGVEFADLRIVMEKTFFLLAAALTAISPSKNVDSQDVFHFLMGRAVKTYRSISVLLFEGNEQDAMALLRGLVEAAITAKYISTGDTKSLAERFRDYQTIEVYRFMSSLRHEDPEEFSKVFPSDRVTRIEEDLAKYEAKYSVKYKDSLSWSGMSYFKMAALPAVNMTSDFTKAYAVFSMFTHASYQAMEDYTQIRQGKRVLLLGPSTKRTSYVGFMATGYLVSVMQSYVNALGVDGLTWLLTEIRCNLAARASSLGYKSEFTISVEPGRWGQLPSFEEIKRQAEQAKQK